MKTAGIDIGGTQLRAAVFDENFNMTDVFKTDNDRSLTAEQNMDKLLTFLQKYRGSLRGIGIGCPGPLNARTGTIISPPNLVGWDGFEIVPYVEEKAGVKAVLNNDGNVAGLAEARLGKGAGLESVVFMGLSTGLGGAFIYKGNVVNGANTNAAEWWNMIVNDDPHCHKNANPGSLNEQSSGSGLRQLSVDAYGEAVHPKEVFARFYAGEETATKLVEHAAETLAKGMANVMCVIDPDIIIVGGSVAIHNPRYVQMAIERAQKYLISPETLRVEEAQFGDDAGLIGAALLV